MSRQQIATTAATFFFLSLLYLFYKLLLWHPGAVQETPRMGEGTEARHLAPWSDHGNLTSLSVFSVFSCAVRRPWLKGEGLKSWVSRVRIGQALTWPKELSLQVSILDHSASAPWLLWQLQGGFGKFKISSDSMNFQRTRASHHPTMSIHFRGPKPAGVQRHPCVGRAARQGWNWWKTCGSCVL